MRVWMIGCGLLATGLLTPAIVANAQTEDSFYQGKRINIVVGYEPGGSYDQYARLLARSLGAHIPGNPQVTVQNMLGAGSRVAANYLYNAAPKDGTVLGMLDQNTPLDQVMGDSSIRFDVRKFRWLGNMVVINNTLVAWHTSGVKTIEEARQKEILIASPGGPSPALYYPLASNAFLGTKFKIVAGYPNATEMNLAMERGEVAARGSNSWQSWKLLKPDWLREGKIHHLFQVGFRREPDLQDVPLMTELATAAQQRDPLELLSSPIAFARTILVPPGVPEERVTVLRKAFDAALADPELLKNASHEKLQVNPLGAREVESMVARTLDARPEIVEQLKQALRVQ